jgi:hypothetical protein
VHTGRLVRAWHPIVHGGDVFTLTFSKSSGGLVVGGNFRALNSAARRDLGAVRLGTGRATGWRPKPRCPQRCPVLDVAASRVSVFAAIGGPGGTLAAYNSKTAVIRWADHGDGDVQAVKFSRLDDRVYVGGHFDPRFTTSAGDVVRHQLAAVKPGDGTPDRRFRPAVRPRVPGVWALIVQRNDLLVGGGFTTIGTHNQPGYAEFAAR